MKKIIPILILFAFFSLNMVAQIPTSGLIGYWPFNSNANDSSGNGHNGTVTGALPTTDRFGNLNSAYLFGDTAKYITIPDAAQLRLNNTDFTVSFWFLQNNNLSNQEAVITKRGAGSQNGYIMNVIGSSSPQAGHFNYQVSGGVDPKVVTDSILNLGSWHHIAIVYSVSNQRLRIYVNGIKNADSTGIPSPNANTAVNMIIGKDGVTGVYPFHGKIDDIAMYNRALAISEIYQLYAPCNSVDISNNIVARYNFSGDANDNSGNNHHGTVSGAMLTTDRFGNANNAYSFNGTSASITVPDNAALRLNNTDFTISAWLNQSSIVATNAAIISKRAAGNQNGYIFNVTGNGLNPSRRLSFNVSGGTDPKATSDSIITVNTWHHVAVVYDLSTKTMLTYMDGLLNSSKAGLPSPNAATAAIMNIGSDGTGNPYFFNGKIDDIRIYNRSLSACDIDSLYNLPDPLLSGLNDLHDTGSIQIYPNPANDYISISTIQFMDVTICNAIGQAVKSSTIIPGNHTIDISGLPSGLYFVNFSDTNHRVTVKKIIKF